MSASTIREYAGTLIVVRCWCGIQHAIPETLRRIQLEARDEGAYEDVFCPLGHEHHPTGDSRLDIANQKLARAESAHDRTRAALNSMERSRRAARAATTRLKNRVGNGVCPYCNRQFANMACHIRAKHADYMGTQK